MTKNLPDPSRRSFITRLTKSFLEMAQELNRWAETWRGDEVSPPPSPASVDSLRQLEQQYTEQIRTLAKLPPAYLIFLRECFKKPKTISEIPFGPASLPDESWQEFADQEPLQMIEELRTISALVRSDLPTHLAHKFSHQELTAMLRSHRLPRPSKKHDMAVQLAQSVPQAMWAAVDDLLLLECTPLAWDTAQACLKRREVTSSIASTAEPAPDQADEKASKEATLIRVIKATLKTAGDGIIGNRVDAVLLALIAYVVGTTTSEAGEQAVPISPLPTPQSDTPAPEPLPEPQRQPTPRPRSTPIPPLAFDWVTIPAGEFWMGSNTRKDPLAYEGETPQHKVYLPTYRIARYPVTVAQFAQFSKTTGYQTTAEKEGGVNGWSGSSWEYIKGAYWAHPRGPESDVQNKANHPVTCVSWVDVNEFCRWAGVCLASEAEWEKAARGTDGRIYPWGNEAPDKERCNFHGNVGDMGDTTPVDRYPKGKSFYEVWDMAGNVWEWTSSLWGQIWGKPDFGYPYDLQDGREDPVATGLRVVRGGAFGDNRSRVRCASRHWDVPYIGNYAFGFRVVLSPGS